MFFPFRKNKNRSKKTSNDDVKISAIYFTEEKLIIILSGNHISNDSHLIIRDMNDPKESYKFSSLFTQNDGLTEELITEISIKDIPFIKIEGKWSLYYKNNNDEIRLAPTQALIESITNCKRFYHNELLTEPYITIKENISFRTIKNPNKSVEKQINSFVYEINYINNVLWITGKISENSNDINNARLLIQKRNSSLSYDFPIQWIEQGKWRSSIDFKHNAFPKGTWDYYIQYNQNQKIRISINDQHLSPEQKPILYKHNNEVIDVTHYQTIKGSFSTKHKTATIQLSNIAGSIEDGKRVKISGYIENNALLKDVSLNDIKFTIIENDSELKYETDTTVISNDKVMVEMNLDYNQIFPFNQTEKKKWDIYLNLKIHETELLVRVKTEQNTLQKDTLAHFYEPEVRQLYFYSTVNNYLSVYLTKPIMQKNLDEFILLNGKLILKGYAYFNGIDFTNENTIKRNIIIRKRNSDKEIHIPVSSIENEKLNNEYHDYRYAGFNVEIPLKEMFSIHDSLKEVYDFYICLTYINYSSEKRLGCNNYIYIVDEPIDKVTQKYNSDYMLNYLLLTPGGNIKLESYNYSMEKINYITGTQKENKLTSPNVWLIGERPDTAQDTGYHFFKYCRENYPEKEIYYVIEKTSKDLKNIEHLGNVIFFGSTEHFRVTSIASTFIGSHDLEYILPTRAVDWPSYQEGNRVFLQHGILGRKKVDYYKKFYKYPFHIFCVSSESEYNLVNNEMGYTDEEIKITGLSRFDNLLTNHHEDKSIAVIPTWRDWLNESNFIESNYYEHYKQLLTDNKLMELLKSTNIKLKFYPHYRMQHFFNHFKELESEYVEIIKLGQIDVQQILKKNKLLITDYSTVSFDFNYMSKPVIFYHFDFNKFFQNGILRPKEETFLGDIHETKTQVVKEIENYIDNGFEEKHEFNNKKHLNFSYIDRNNNKRIFDEINRLVKEGQPND
ncbi:CDP-glycerol glycerophosphotransferase, TagB/SpsB family [Virgibacillus subterraneus]|uniref:CDP-glycerol glycerophosphotransferase, TagB/SpsB family n=1 Tax=Virgibacillus subterraneus TaxID=621109 RepID=A0A1H9AH27_9BACI|nr:CDP-glycerol glycerophosphotransferase family protein [Virgibacillus subterraneus]SEP75278.1 CDP-glycerol glycerophosphotransferase, TagB/SpsB family [Virgibacillus subterraneus]